MESIKKIFESCILCIKYPFLYPRNRFTGFHYDNWKFRKYLNGDPYIFKSQHGETNCMNDGLYQKAFEYKFEDSEDFIGKLVVKNWFYAIWFYICDFIYKHPMQWIHCIPTYTEWDMMEIGWRKAFGDQYLKDLKKQLKKDGILYSWRITELKEKYGTLRLYCNFGSDELYKLIDRYEKLSAETCYKCGEPATIITDRYVLPYCEKCFNKENNKYKERYDIDEDYLIIRSRKINGEWKSVNDK